MFSPVSAKKMLAVRSISMVLLCCSALVLLQADATEWKQAFSVRFRSFAAGPLGPSQDDVIAEFESRLSTYLWPAGGQSCSLVVFNYTVTCTDEQVCYPSAIVAFNMVNGTWAYNQIANPPEGFAALAVTLNVNAISNSLSLFGTVFTKDPAMSARTFWLLVTLCPLTGVLLCVGLWVWLRRKTKGEANLDDREALDDEFERSSVSPGGREMNLNEPLKA